MTSRFHLTNVVATGLWPVFRNRKPHERPAGLWLQPVIVATTLSVLLLAGCNKKSGSTVQNSNKVRIGYIGLTCEAPIYAAYERDSSKRRDSSQNW
jgi:hypothetical protein